MKEPWQDTENLDDALLPPEDELTDLADDLGWNPEPELPVEDDD
jgi:hypothetical protein